MRTLNSSNPAVVALEVSFRVGLGAAGHGQEK